MKKIIILTLMTLAFGITDLQAQSSYSSCCSKKSTDVSVSGYYKSNGTYVQPHYRTKSNGTKRDNFSYPGNKNPYTGKKSKKSSRSSSIWLND